MNPFRSFWNLIISIPKDKLLHGIAGALICLYAFAVAFRFCLVWLCFVIANAAALVVLLLKELYDKLHPKGHSVEWMDVVAGVVGAILVDGAMLIMLL